MTPHTEAAYIKALSGELQMRKEYLPPSEPVETIYFGGGTPSLLSADSLQSIVHSITETYATRLRLKEFTVECNPDDVTPQLAASLARLGVNRISMGVQSFNPQILSFLHRRHDNIKVIQAIDTLRNAGISNISIDLIYGIPGQTMQLWKADIEQAIQLSVPHISSYALSYEEDTPLTLLLKRGEVASVSDEEYLRMYLTLIDRLSDAGFEHYEISNFARPGFRSLHNSSYWSGAPYLGLGAGAHSYHGITASPQGFGTTSRQWNLSDIQQYVSAYNPPHPPFHLDSEGEDIQKPWVFENLSAHEQYNDIIVTQLRRSEGIDLSILPIPYRTHLLHAAERSITNGALSLTEESLRLTRKSLFISDTIMTELILE